MDSQEDLQEVLIEEEIQEDVNSAIPCELCWEREVSQFFATQEHSNVCQNGGLLDRIVPWNTELYYEK